MNIPEILAGIRASGLVRPTFLAGDDYSPEILEQYRENYSVAGFGIVAQPDGYPALRARFPWVALFLDRVHVRTNALYMNPVVATAGSRMVKHLDNTLRCYNPLIDNAYKVTIFYLEVEDLVGGHLIVEDAKPIHPAVGLWVQFEGFKRHEMTRVISGTRTAFVMEEYRLTPEQLEGVPVYALR